MAMSLDIMFLEIVVVALFARFISYFFYRIKAPRVVGDIVAGCLLGPTVLQAGSINFFATNTRDTIAAIGYLGLIMASMTSGANFDTRVLSGKVTACLLFSVFNIATNVGAAYAVEQLLPTNSDFRGPNYASGSYELYLACGFAATSLPMTFLILDELHLTNKLAKFCIGASALATVELFTLVSIASAIASPSAAFGNGLIPFRIGMLITLILSLQAMRWFWERGLRLDKSPTSWFRRTTTDQSLIIICICIGAAVVADVLGYSFVLGAFLAGASLPLDLEAKDDQITSHVRTDFTKAIKWTARWILLPMYFLEIGLNLDLRYLGNNWGYVFLLLAWGYASKALCAPFARFALGFSWNDSLFLASIANCRGFNGLVVALQALGAGQFGPVPFATCVLFSITTSTVASFACKYFHERETKRLADLEEKQSDRAQVSTKRDEPSSEEEPEPDFEVVPFWRDENVPIPPSLPRKNTLRHLDVSALYSKDSKGRSIGPRATDGERKVMENHDHEHELTLNHTRNSRVDTATRLDLTLHLPHDTPGRLARTLPTPSSPGLNSSSHAVEMTVLRIHEQESSALTSTSAVSSPQHEAESIDKDKDRERMMSDEKEKKDAKVSASNSVDHNQQNHQADKQHHPS